MTGTFPTPLLARRERLWPVLLLSFGCHAAVLGFAALHRPAPIIDLEKPMQARLVRLGEKRPESFLPRKEQAPAPAPAPGLALPAPGAKVAPARPAAPASSRPDPLAAALARVRRDQSLGERPIWGDEHGDVLGDTSEASEGDRYLALITRALQDNYRLPSTISQRDRELLKASVVLFIEPDGRISRWRFETRSGNAAFDEALERTIRQTRPPPPPAELREHYRNDGILVRFHI